MVKKHQVEVLEYDDDSGTYYGCVNCGLFMGIIYGEIGGTDYSHMSEVCGEDGECPGHPLQSELVFTGFREFWVSPDYGGNITDSIRRLYGGSGHLSSVEKITEEEFESDYGPCLALKVWESGALEAITDKHIVTIHEYDGAEWLESVERTPEWFKELGNA